MIAGPYPEARIVRTWPADRTGESYYEDENGRVWRTTFYTPTLTGVEYGSIEGDRIISPARARVPSSGGSLPPPPSDLEEFHVEYPEVVKPLPRKRMRPQRRVAAFVGAGAMRRRWR